MFKTFEIEFILFQVQRWFRQRKLAEMPSTLQKFCETGWRFVFYTGIFVYGLAVLWHKPYFWDINLCWFEYPKHKVNKNVKRHDSKRKINFNCKGVKSILVLIFNLICCWYKMSNNAHHNKKLDKT